MFLISVYKSGRVIPTQCKIYINCSSGKAHVFNYINCHSQRFSFALSQVFFAPNGKPRCTRTIIRDLEQLQVTLYAFVLTFCYSYKKVSQLSEMNQGKNRNWSKFVAWHHTISVFLLISQPNSVVPKVAYSYYIVQAKKLNDPTILIGCFPRLYLFSLYSD